MSPETSNERPQSLGEQIADSVTHGVGLVASVVGLVVLVATTLHRGDPWLIASCLIYASTLVLLYAASTLYHALSATRARHVFQILDHAAIYLLIAGTYTPFALVNLRGPWGWTILAIVWSLAVLGVVAKSVFGTRWPVFSTVLYLAMGWTIVVAIKPLVTHVAPAGIAWLVAGGLAYTGGVAFFAWDRLRYNHAVWHLFVLGGSACHFVAVLFYVVR
ncbi:MAG: hemolysin III family protein [Acidobacteriota bacterium]